MTEKLIRMHSHDPCIITAQEYEQLQKEVTARILLDEPGIGDRILAKILLENEHRYREIV